MSLPGLPPQSILDNEIVPPLYKCSSLKVRVFRSAATKRHRNIDGLVALVIS
jgi:hypothetical protein